jgi:hypothetical protein
MRITKLSDLGILADVADLTTLRFIQRVGGSFLNVSFY